MTKQDKRVCGVCLEHGHTSVDCPRRHGDMVMVSEALPDELRRLQAASAERERARMAYTARHEPSAMVYTGPYEEVPAPTITLPPQVTQDNVTGCPTCLAKDGTIAGLQRELDRLKGQNADRQRAYRERRA